MNVAILGASAKHKRYSHKVMLLLADKGHAVFPVNPALATELRQHGIDVVEACTLVMLRTDQF